VESTLEDPLPVVRKQVERARSDAISRMKAEGVPYEERMEQLEEIQHPQPEKEFLEACFEEFCGRNPWVGGERISPKSVARELLEKSRAFEDYVKDYGLERAEGMVLRYFSGTYKALSQTVPDAAKDALLWEIEAYLGALLRQVDSSLLDLWETMCSGGIAPRIPEREASVAGFRPGAPEDITRDEGAFLERARASIFAALRALGQGEWDVAWEALTGAPADAASEEQLRVSVQAFWDARGRFRLDAEGRNRRHTYSLKNQDSDEWKLQQMLVDPEGFNDWVLECAVDVDASRAALRPVLTWIRLGPLEGV
jgi:hypothetical protein